MFTGIITDIGTLRSREDQGDTSFRIATHYTVETIETGASIACDGVCLTVVETGRTKAGEGWFAVEASAETQRCTVLGEWREGRRVNLERALRIGDELGGHFVSGHVDGVGEVREITSKGDSIKMHISFPGFLACYLCPKGSVSVNGVSLTVNTVRDTIFSVNIISHTQRHTTLGSLTPGDRVNLEADMLARYVLNPLLERQSCSG